MLRKTEEDSRESGGCQATWNSSTLTIFTNRICLLFTFDSQTFHFGLFTPTGHCLEQYNDLMWLSFLHNERVRDEAYLGFNWVLCLGGTDPFFLLPTHAYAIWKEQQVRLWVHHSPLKNKQISHLNKISLIEHTGKVAVCVGGVGLGQRRLFRMEPDSFYRTFHLSRQCCTSCTAKEHLPSYKGVLELWGATQ